MGSGFSVVVALFSGFMVLFLSYYLLGNSLYKGFSFVRLVVKKKEFF